MWYLLICHPFIHPTPRVVYIYILNPFPHTYSILLEGELGGVVRPSECLWTLEVRKEGIDWVGGHLIGEGGGVHGAFMR